MVRSLGVVVAVVVVLVVLAAGPDRDPVRTVDVSAPLAQARSQAAYDVLAPTGLDPSWRPTSARAERSGSSLQWHLGYVTPAGAYAGVEQSDVRDPSEVRRYVDRFVAGGRRGGTEQVGGRQWQRIEGGDPEPRALLLREGAVVTLVVGSASWAELSALAARLRG
jgi:hypothetical protein